MLNSATRMWNYLGSFPLDNVVGTWTSGHPKASVG